MKHFKARLQPVLAAGVALGLALTVEAQDLRPSVATKEVRVTTAPAVPTAPWQPPDLGGYARTLAPAESTEVVAGRAYSLPELIDIAERTNPATRAAWERASAAAAALGLAKSEYFPVLAAEAGVFTESVPVALPKSVLPEGDYRADIAASDPRLELRWVLLDFGRRSAAADAARQRLLAANLGFNAEHERVVFDVERRYFELANVRGQIAVADAALESAKTVQAAAEARLDQGLATLPDVSLAREHAAQAAFDAEDVRSRERDAQVALAESLGVLPTTPVEVEDFSKLPIPNEVEPSVERVINRALEQRPDLLAKVAGVREKESDLRRARKNYYPTVTLTANAGYALAAARNHVGSNTEPWFSASGPTYGVRVGVSWSIFDGGARRHEVELAEAQLREAEAEVDAARDRTINEVWRSYTDAKMAIRRLEVAVALVDAAQKSYDSQYEAYTVGVGTLVDLLGARRELSRAQFVELDTKVRVLTSVAALAYANGDLGPQLLRRPTK
jgi:outer membrane protein TolC